MAAGARLFGGGALVFGAALALLAILYFTTRTSRVLLFWAAFILTRPLGATVGDFLDKPVAKGGLELSRPLATLALAVAIVMLILVLPQRPGQHPGRAEGDCVKPDRGSLAALLSAAAAAPALAGPPYQTDDPEPTELGHWEIYNPHFDGRAAGMTARRTRPQLWCRGGPQLTATLPVAFAQNPAAAGAVAAATSSSAQNTDSSDDESNGWQAAVFPRVILPTAARDLGGPHSRPAAAVGAEGSGQKSVFGGGGYEINPGRDNRDFWQAGVAVTHDFSKSTALGAELAWQSSDTRDGKSSTGVNVGLIQKLGGPYSLLLAAGPIFSGGEASYHGYAALSLNF